MQRHRHKSAHERSHVKTNRVNTVGKQHGYAFASFETESGKGVRPAHHALVGILYGECLPLLDAVIVLHVNRNLRPMLQVMGEQFGKRAQKLKLGAAHLHGIGWVGHSGFLSETAISKH